MPAATIPSPAQSDTVADPVDQMVSGVTQQSAADPGPEVVQAPEPTAASSQSVQASEPAPGLLDRARGLGVDLSRYGDEEQALRGLLAAHQQREAEAQYQPYVRAYLEHAGEFQQWMQERQRAEQERQARQAQVWNPPAQVEEVERLMAQWFEKDQLTGEVRPKANAPLDAVQKVQQYGQFSQDWQRKLFHNPVEAIKPLMIPIIQEAMRSEMEAFRQQGRAQSVIERNADWIFRHDPATKARQYDQAGQPILSDEGRAFGGYVAEAARMGIQDVGQQERYALGMVEADLLRRQARPVQRQQQQNRDFTQRANRVANVQDRGDAVRPPTKGLSLVEMLRRDMRDVPDAEFIES